MSHFLISCGGTGGHLSPGIALAEGLTGRGHEVTLLISRKAVDRQLAGKYPHFTFLPIPGSPFGLSPGRLVRFGWQQTQALAFSRRLIRKAHPRAVIGFGGFTSAGIMLAGRAAGVPLVLHEANRVPGRATRVLGRMARRVYLPEGICIRGLDAGVGRSAGFPVRHEIRRVPQEEARRALGLDPGRRVLAVLGGSQGASALNEWARRHAPQLAAAGVQLLCVTGMGKGAAQTVQHPDASGAPVTAIFLPFSDRMAELMSAADLVLSRAGAGTLAELARCGTPAVLVPFPHAADNHQAANAAAFAAQGGGRVVGQGALASLQQDIVRLIHDDAALERMRAGLRSIDRANALDPMLDDIEAITPDRREADRRPHADAGGKPLP